MSRRTVLCAALSFLLLTGCRTSLKVSDTTEPKLKKLLAKDDSLQRIDRYKDNIYREAQKPAEVEGQYHITTTYDPGYVSFEPTVVTDVVSGEKTRGATVEMRSERFHIGIDSGGGKEGNFVVDQDELGDFTKAVDYIKSTVQQWGSTSDHSRQVMFRTRDGLTLSLEQQEAREPRLYISGDRTDAVINIGLDRCEELKGLATQTATVLQQN